MSHSNEVLQPCRHVARKQAYIIQYRLLHAPRSLSACSCLEGGRRHALHVTLGISMCRKCGRLGDKMVVFQVGLMQDVVGKECLFGDALLHSKGN